MPTVFQFIALPAICPALFVSRTGTGGTPIEQAMRSVIGNPRVPNFSRPVIHLWALHDHKMAWLCLRVGSFPFRDQEVRLVALSPRKKNKSWLSSALPPVLADVKHSQEDPKLSMTW